MKNIFLNLGIFEKYNAFILSLDYQSKIRACVLFGIYKRSYFNINKSCWNIGYIFIGYKNIVDLITKRG